MLDHRGRPRDPDDPGVAELTGLLRRSVRGDRLASWPADMRIVCRSERPSSGAQLSLMAALGTELEACFLTIFALPPPA